MVNVVVVIEDGSTETPVDLTSFSFVAAPSVYPVPRQSIGSEYWVPEEELSASGFTLHVLNPPFGETFTFDCDVQGVTVGYGDVASVKRLCGVEQTVTDVDLDLAFFINSAASIIDDAIADYEETLPLSPVPAIITVIANLYASGLYLGRNNLPQGQTEHPNVMLAKQKLADYKKKLEIAADSSASPFFIGTDTS